MIFTGALQDGYGRIWVGGGRTDYAHRVAWELEHGPIPDDLEIDHKCRQKACIRHLEPVTGKVNAERGERAKRTHCPKGHAYDGANTYVRPDGGRGCVECRTEAARRYAQRGALADAP